MSQQNEFMRFCNDILNTISKKESIAKKSLLEKIPLADDTVCSLLEKAMCKKSYLTQDCKDAILADFMRGYGLVSKR